jgi:hypothetical protein
MGNLMKIFETVELSIFGLKIVGFLLIFTGVAYFSINKSVACTPVLSWRKLFTQGSMLGILNAGIAIFFGKNAYLLTPTIIISFLVLWLMKKMPLWQGGHLLAFISLFITSSIVFFILVAGIFFHIAVDGKV